MHDISSRRFLFPRASLLEPALWLLVSTMGLWGCLGDQILNMDDGEDADQDDDDDLGDDDGSGDADADADGDSDGDADTDQDAGYVLDGDYSDWVNGNDDWAPGEVVSFLDKEENHSPEGWLKARCFGCHGVGKPWEPETSVHDPRMQYWSWSCARGFPAGECHGHGPNTDWQFNHNYPVDPSFFNCTQEGCHDIPFGGSFRDNHGFNQAPDTFCNACHELDWTGWPDGGII